MKKFDYFYMDLFTTACTNDTIIPSTQYLFNKTKEAENDHQTSSFLLPHRHGSCKAAVYEKHGLTQSTVKITYGDHTFKVNFEVGEKAATGGVDPTYFKGLERHGWKHGLDTSDLNKEVVLGRKTYIFRGINQTGHFCIGEDKAAPGKLFKLKGDEVAKALGKTAKAGTLIEVAPPFAR